MKKVAILLAFVLLIVFTSSAMAETQAAPGWKSAKAGKVYLFQKCDESLVDPALYDDYGCPLPGNGPWPIIWDNRKWGKLNYSLYGHTFKFTFQGKRLVPATEYTLIYYPDPWPGNGLICLGSGKSNHAGNIQLHGKKAIFVKDASDAIVQSGLPAYYDKNYLPISPSGAVGAKIWLVPTADVQCGNLDDGTPSKMMGWTPQDYLFEGNLIIYQYTP